MSETLIREIKLNKQPVSKCTTSVVNYGNQAVTKSS